VYILAVQAIGSVVVILVAFALWGLVHSALAGPRAKAAASRAWGPAADRWYRLAYNALAFLSFAPVAMLPALLPDRALYAARAPLAWLLQGVQAAAVLAAVVTVRLTGAAEILGLAPASPSARLVVAGPYRYVRHPLYLLALVLMWANPAMTVNRAMLSGLMSLYLYVGSLHEEASLQRRFGGEYARYRGQVPGFLPWPGRSWRTAPPRARPTGR
jgi:methanethiol S-methyltransferase